MLQRILGSHLKVYKLFWRFYGNGERTLSCLEDFGTYSSASRSKLACTRASICAGHARQLFGDKSDLFQYRVQIISDLIVGESYDGRPHRLDKSAANGI